jgi:glycine cleavage system H protein
MELPSGLKFTKEHEWVRVEGNVAQIGVTDYAQESLGDIVFLELPECGTHFDIGDTFGVVESVKAVSDLYSPLTGTITEINEPLIDAPEGINEHPYEDGWMISIELDDDSELEELMDKEAYSEYVKEIS